MSGRKSEAPRDSPGWLREQVRGVREVFEFWPLLGFAAGWFIVSTDLLVYWETGSFPFDPLTVFGGGMMIFHLWVWVMLTRRDTGTEGDR